MLIIGCKLYGYYRPQTKFAKVMFLQVSVCPQGRGACVVAWGGAWLLWGVCVVAPGGACVVALGGMHGCSGGCVCGCSRGGMHGCSRGGACMGYDEIRRYDQ